MACVCVALVRLTGAAGAARVCRRPARADEHTHTRTRACCEPRGAFCFRTRRDRRSRGSAACARPRRESRIGSRPLRTDWQLAAASTSASRRHVASGGTWSRSRGA
eukprot:6806360-Prymnesium_polylepis.1